jgi:hypothetical protein
LHPYFRYALQAPFLRPYSDLVRLNLCTTSKPDLGL